EVDQLVVNRRALREENRHRRREVREHEQAELLAELAVIARVRLFHALQVRGQLVLVRPRGAVDALEHGVVLVAAPVRAGHGGQLERAEAAGGGDVRSAAEIEPLALPINGGRLIAGIPLMISTLYVSPSFWNVSMACSRVHSSRRTGRSRLTISDICA